MNTSETLKRVSLVFIYFFLSLVSVHLRYVYIYIYIPFLSRTYFVERSTQLIEEHQL